MVPDCLRLTPGKITQYQWLPATCAYRLRAADRPLPQWHYLICGDRDAVHRAGVSVRGRAISEDLAGPIEQHILTREANWTLGISGDRPGDEQDDA